MLRKKNSWILLLILMILSSCASYPLPESEVCIYSDKSLFCSRAGDKYIRKPVHGDIVINKADFQSRLEFLLDMRNKAESCVLSR